jgi:hypothetical protein
MIPAMKIIQPVVVVLMSVVEAVMKPLMRGFILMGRNKWGEDEQSGQWQSSKEGSFQRCIHRRLLSVRPLRF